ncbi:HNH endonuclease signature motif containing protein [Aquipuribacter hungaricus]|uniref:DUF222 domain-containing protein n=1 Tax=Aquipuribacter hungaricus TaxID=545624 RepID=A0ABV7WIT9_9MICO
MTSSTGVTAGAAPPGDLPACALAAALAEASDALGRAAALTAPGAAWQVADADVLDGIRRVAALRGRVEAVYLDLVRELDGRALATSSPVATTPEAFLRTVCLMGAGQARRDVAAARATAPTEPLAVFAEELSQGRRTRAHVDVAVRCLDRLPASLLARPGAAADVVDFLRRAADDAAPLDMDRAARQLLARLDPAGDERRERFDPDGHTRRFLEVHTDATGMVVGAFQLDAVSGATLRAALDTASAPEPGADGEPDRRQARQRRADALVRVAETALGVAVPRRGERPRVVLHVTPSQVAGLAGAGLGRTEAGDPLSPASTRRLVCDAVLQRVVSTPSLGPLDVGREHRLVTLAQRRALAARDGGCTVPGCGAPPDWCDAHHIVHWADGGPSDLDNYTLLCPGHHTAVHAGTWQVHGRGGQITVTPPRWVDPTRTPRRVRHHVVEDLVRDLGDPDVPDDRTERHDHDDRTEHDDHDDGTERHEPDHRTERHEHDDGTERLDQDDGLTGSAAPDEQPNPPPGAGPAAAWRRELDELFTDRAPACRPGVGDDAVHRLLLSEAFSARRDEGRRYTVTETDRVDGRRGHPAGRDGPGATAGMA